jgi:hypothetical protein
MNHLIFVIILLCILNVYGKFVPEARLGHSAVYINSKRRIYYIGGYKSIQTKPGPLSAFFYLNVNTSGNNLFEFTDLTSQVNLPATIHHVSELGGVNQDLIFILGGEHWYETETINYVYSFNIETNELSVPVVQGKTPPMRKGISSVIYEGKIYLFGGQTSGGYNVVFYDNFDIFDTINLNWQVGSLVNSPATRTLYSATLVYGVIYYIGGRNPANVYTPLTEVQYVTL